MEKYQQQLERPIDWFAMKGRRKGRKANDQLIVCSQLKLNYDEIGLAFDDWQLPWRRLLLLGPSQEEYGAAKWAEPGQGGLMTLDGTVSFA